MKTVALYLRVSTDGQTVENQRLELEAAAARHGWEVAAVIADEGISGAKGRLQRPGFDRLQHRRQIIRLIGVVAVEQGDISGMRGGNRAIAPLVARHVVLKVVRVIWRARPEMAKHPVGLLKRRCGR